MGSNAYQKVIGWHLAAGGCRLLEVLRGGVSEALLIHSVLPGVNIKPAYIPLIRFV